MHSQNPLILNYPDSRTTRSRRRHLCVALVLGFSVLTLAACENLPILSRVQRAFDFAVFGQPDFPMTRAYVDSLPYASIRAKLGRSGKVLMILGRYDGNDLHWISADNSVITTRHGRIVKTLGLKYDLNETRFPDADPIASGAQDLEHVTSYARLVDFANEKRYGVLVVSTFNLVGSERIEILDQAHDTLLFREKVRVDQLDWTYENLFWLDTKTGYVWRSIQYFSPELPPIEMDILKPAA
ncbi:MAG: YjbF family lipoprotein [Rhodospirillales bacterium]